MIKTVALLYGILEGPRHGKRFRQELKRAGYEIISDTTVADCIIGHSAGCYFLPTDRTKQVIMLIDPPYWPGKSILTRIADKLTIDVRYGLHPSNFLYWMQKNSWNIYYGIRDFSHTKAVFRAAKTYDVEAIIKTHQAILVRNTDDAWLTPDLAQLQADDPAITVRDLPGEHDDCWRHPEAYVAILASL